MCKKHQVWQVWIQHVQVASFSLPPEAPSVVGEFSDLLSLSQSSKETFLPTQSSSPHTTANNERGQGHS